MKLWITHDGDNFWPGTPDHPECWEIDVPLLLAAKFVRVMEDFGDAQYGIDKINRAYLRRRREERA
jgi:hypothetical protein